MTTTTWEDNEIARLLAEVHLERHRADENQRRVEALERQALADAEVTRGLRELVDCAAAYVISGYMVQRFAGRWSLNGAGTNGELVCELFDSPVEALQRARDLAAKGKGET